MRTHACVSAGQESGLSRLTAVALHQVTVAAMHLSWCLPRSLPSGGSRPTDMPPPHLSSMQGTRLEGWLLDQQAPAVTGSLVTRKLMTASLTWEAELNAISVLLQARAGGE